MKQAFFTFTYGGKCPVVYCFPYSVWASKLVEAQIVYWYSLSTSKLWRNIYALCIYSKFYPIPNCSPIPCSQAVDNIDIAMHNMVWKQIQKPVTVGNSHRFLQARTNITQSRSFLIVNDFVQSANCPIQSKFCNAKSLS